MTYTAILTAMTRARLNNLSTVQYNLVAGTYAASNRLTGLLEEEQDDGWDGLEPGYELSDI